MGRAGPESVPSQLNQFAANRPRTGVSKMPSDKTLPLTDLKLALKLVNDIEKNAQRIDDPELKRILLISGCDIIDRVMNQQTRAAA